MARPIWRFVLSHTPPNGVEFMQLDEAYGRHITYRLDGISDAQFSLQGTVDEARLIDELSTDLIAYRTNQIGVTEKVYRGRIITETDDVTANNHVCQFSTNDYRGMLDHRLVGSDGRTFNNVDAGLIAWTLIAESQALVNGNWGITNGIGQNAGVSHTITYDPGAKLLDLITNLGHRDQGAFEWEIDANLALNRWYPKRGTATGAILDYGGIVSGMRKTLTSNSFANSLLLTGDGSVTDPVVVNSPTIASDPPGRWEDYVGFADIKEQTTLQERASFLLGLTRVLRPEWIITLTPGRWDRATMNLGDTIRFVGRSGRLTIDGMYRIIEIAVSIDQENTEDVQLGLLAL